MGLAHPGGSDVESRGQSANCNAETVLMRAKSERQIQSRLCVAAGSNEQCAATAAVMHVYVPVCECVFDEWPLYYIRFCEYPGVFHEHVFHEISSLHRQRVETTSHDVMLTGSVTPQKLFWHALSSAARSIESSLCLQCSEGAAEQEEPQCTAGSAYGARACTQCVDALAPVVIRRRSARSQTCNPEKHTQPLII